MTTDTHFSHKVWHESPAVGKAQFPWSATRPTADPLFGVHIPRKAWRCAAPS